MRSVVIPAGGAGRRFWPWSRAVPKYMLLLGDRPLLHHALDEAAGAGFGGAVLVVAPEHRALLESYLAAADLPLPVSLLEQPSPHGVGDAVLLGAAVAGTEFGVLLPDDVVRTVDHWRRLDAAPGAALCFREVPAEDIGRYGVGVIEAGRATRLIEKPPPGTVDSRWAIFGRYRVTEAVLAALEAARPPAGELQLTDGFAALVPDVFAVEFGDEVFDCGTPAAAAEAQARWYRRTEAGIAQEARWRMPALADRMRALGALREGPIDEAFRQVPRHLYVPEQPVEHAYTDTSLPVKADPESGTWLSSSSQPSMMAIMLRQLAVEPGQRILEVGAATGYNAALLAHLAGVSGQVVSVELDSELAARAAGALAAAGIANASVTAGDGAVGHVEHAPYDRIIVTCGATDLAPAWYDQLREGGRLVVPLTLADQVTWSIGFDRAGGELRSVSLEGCGFIPMRGLLGGTPVLDAQASGPLARSLRDIGSVTAVMIPAGQEPGADGNTIRLPHATLTIR